MENRNDEVCFNVGLRVIKWKHNFSCLTIDWVCVEMHVGFATMCKQTRTISEKQSHRLARELKYRDFYFSFNAIFNVLQQTREERT